VGVGLDYGIHLAFDQESIEGGPGAVFLRVAANVVVAGVGLAVLMLSANPTIAKLGLLIVLSLVASGYTAILVFARERQAEAGEGARSDRDGAGLGPAQVSAPSPQ